MNLIKLLFAILISTVSIAQQKVEMRTLSQLINTEESMWPTILGWADSAVNKVQILPVDTAKCGDALLHTHVTTRSTMGAIVYHSGGILVDNGWIRILGSGSLELTRSLPDWNKDKTFNEFGDIPGYLLIADDAVGGFFVLNGGEFDEAGKVYYLAPESLEFESLGITYTEFILFCFNNDLSLFYKDARWKNWEKDLETLKADQVFNFYPPLWSKEGADINLNFKKPVPVEEQYILNMDLRKQLGIDE